jgi:hypothetical protein
MLFFKKWPTLQFITTDEISLPVLAQQFGWSDNIIKGTEL